MQKPQAYRLTMPASSGGLCWKQQGSEPSSAKNMQADTKRIWHRLFMGWELDPHMPAEML